MEQTSTLYYEKLTAHYILNWGRKFTIAWERTAPVYALHPLFHVLKFKPDGQRNFWTYATCGMAANSISDGLELHIIADEEQDEYALLLASAAFNHLEKTPLAITDEIFFGDKLKNVSPFPSAIILPSITGPEKIQTFNSPTGANIKCCQLVPLTASELKYMDAKGDEALIQLISDKQPLLENPWRQAVV